MHQLKYIQGWPCIGCHDLTKHVALLNSTSVLSPNAESVPLHRLPGAVVARLLISVWYSVVEVLVANLSSSEQVGYGL